MIEAYGLDASGVPGSPPNAFQQRTSLGLTTRFDLEDVERSTIPKPAARIQIGPADIPVFVVEAM